MALGKGSKDPSVQESDLPEVCFFAGELGNGRVWVQIRKKDKKTFAVWVHHGGKAKVTDMKVPRAKLENAFDTRELTLGQVKLIDCDSRGIKKILNAK